MTELSRVDVIISEWVENFGSGQETGVSVPCGECHACCTKVNAQLYPEELKSGYIKKFNKSENKYHLKHKSNGECVYLNKIGCSIHTKVPKVCRTFDCRVMGFFKIRDPKNEHINLASKRWDFVVDRPDIFNYLYKYFEVGVNMLPVKSGTPVDNVAKQAMLSAYRKFFEAKTDA